MKIANVILTIVLVLSTSETLSAQETEPLVPEVEQDKLDLIFLPRKQFETLMGRLQELERIIPSLTTDWVLYHKKKTELEKLLELGTCKGV